MSVLCRNCGHLIIKTAADDWVHKIAFDRVVSIVNHETGQIRTDQKVNWYYICAQGWWNNPVRICGCNSPEPKRGVAKK